MGWQRASAVLLASEWIDADQAVAAGLALRVCPAGTVLDETIALARRIASFPPHATRQIKRLMMAARRPAIDGGPGPGGGGLRRPVRRPRAPTPGPQLDRRTGALTAVRLGITAFLTDRAMAPADAGPGGRGARLPLALPPRAHPPAGAGRHPAGPGRGGARSTTTAAASTRSWPWPRAASVTERILLGTGVVLVAQHDPIVLAKQVATLDHLSGGRVVLGIGFGWNRAEAADHGVAFERPAGGGPGARPVHAGPVGRGPGRVPRRATSRSTPAGAGPSRCSSPRVTTLIGGAATPSVFAAIAEYADGWMPVGGAGLAEALPRLRRAVEERRPRPRRGPGGPLRNGAQRPEAGPLRRARASTRWCCGCRPGAPATDARRARRPCRLPRPLRWRRWLSRGPDRGRRRPGRGAAAAGRSWPTPSAG